MPGLTDGNKEVSVAPKISSWHEVCFVALDDDSTCVSAPLLLTVTKFLTKSNLRKLGFILTHSSRIQSTMMRLSWRQELEATVKMVGSRNSQEAEWYGGWFSATLFLLYILGPGPRKFSGGLSTSDN